MSIDKIGRRGLLIGGAAAVLAAGGVMESAAASKSTDAGKYGKLHKVPGQHKPGKPTKPSPSPTTQPTSASPTATPTSASPTATATSTVTSTSPSPTATSTTTSASPTATATSTTSAPGVTPALAPSLAEEFNESSWPNNPMSPDGIWRMNGDWPGTNGNMMLKENIHFGGGYVSLTTQANSTNSAEVQSVISQHTLGYYETRMKVSNQVGVVNSFFWKSSTDGGEIDMEFTTGGNVNGVDQNWVGSGKGMINVFIKPQGTIVGTGNPYEVANLVLPFDPSAGFHTYGWVWTTSFITFYADGQELHTFNNLPAELANPNAKGDVILNTWTGNKYWGGGPPTADATVQYDYVRYWKGVSYPVRMP